jgi:hypothetical protein
MGINTPRSPEKREPKTDGKRGQSKTDKTKESTKDKVHKILNK